MADHYKVGQNNIILHEILSTTMFSLRKHFLFVFSILTNNYKHNVFFFTLFQIFKDLYNITKLLFCIAYDVQILKNEK
jgi:hypothetical protein